MIAVKDVNRYELHFRQFMLMANTVTNIIDQYSRLGFYTFFNVIGKNTVN